MRRKGVADLFFFLRYPSALSKNLRKHLKEVEDSYKQTRHVDVIFITEKLKNSLASSLQVDIFAYINEHRGLIKQSCQSLAQNKRLFRILTPCCIPWCIRKKCKPCWHDLDLWRKRDRAKPRGIKFQPVSSFYRILWWTALRPPEAASGKNKTWHVFLNQTYKFSFRTFPNCDFMLTGSFAFGKLKYGISDGAFSWS